MTQSLHQPDDGIFCRTLTGRIIAGLLMVSFCGGSVGCHSFRRQPVEADVAASRELSLRGLEAWQRGDRDEAEMLLERAVKACPRDDRARKRYADVLRERGAIDEAIAQMEQAIRLSGDDPVLRVELGDIYLERGNTEFAERLADAALTSDGQLASAWTLLGRVRQRQSDWDDALACYHRSLSIEPQSPDVQLAIAEIYRIQGLPLRAYSTLQRLAREVPDDAVTSEMNTLQGLALRDLGRHRQAASRFRDAIDIDPDSSELYALLAETLWISGDQANAQITIAQALERFPGDRRITQIASMQSQFAPPAGDSSPIIR